MSARIFAARAILLVGAPIVIVWAVVERLLREIPSVLQLAWWDVCGATRTLRKAWRSML
jgi:hypothetical protein